MQNEREAVAAAARRLAADGLVRGTSGNLSVRTGDRIAVTPTGAVLAELQAADVCVVDRAGTLLDGPFAPTSELRLHLGVYDRYAPGAVVHTHAPMATAVACVLDELPAIHYEMLALGGAVRVAPYATFGTDELATAVLDALEGRTAVLMGSHGAVTHGADLQRAVAVTELLEWAATLYHRAAQMGTPRTLTGDQLAAVANAIAGSGYGAPRPA